MLAPFFALLPLPQIKLALIAALIVGTLGTMSGCKVRSMVADWQQRRTDAAAMGTLKSALERQATNAAAEQRRAEQRDADRADLAEHLRELRRGLAHVNNPVVVTVSAASPAAVRRVDPVDPAERLRILRAALERGDRAGRAADAAKR